MAKRTNQTQKPLTARPARAGDRLQGTQGVDAGLSVAPEDLGLQFLRTATEQGNFESSDGGGAGEMSITDGAPSDDALPGPAYDSGRSLWESTVALTLESSGEDATHDDAQGGQEETRDTDEVNVTGEEIHEASLFDREAATLGEVKQPKTTTEDGGSHSKHSRNQPPPLPRASR